MSLGNVRLCMYIMCLFIFEEKVEILDQNTLSLNPDQKVDDPILGSMQGRNIGPFFPQNCIFSSNTKVTLDRCTT